MTRTIPLLLSFICAFLLATSANAQNTNTLTAKEKAQGFELLFDGKALSPDIWHEKAIAGYPIEDGVIVCRKGGNLLTKKAYGDFILRLEFKLPPGGNNGVGIRVADVNKDAAYNAMEIQVLDNFADKHKSLQPYQYHGSIYGVVPAKRNAEKNDYQKPLGEWNYQEIIAKGSNIKVILNGETIVDADISEFKTKPTIDGKEHPGLHQEKGSIGFLGHGDPVEFRNIRIKPLDEVADKASKSVRPIIKRMNDRRKPVLPM